jgi:hypothetical protein
MILTAVETSSNVIVFKGHHLFHQTPMDATHRFMLKAIEIRIRDVVWCMVGNLHIHGNNKQITIC